MTKQEELIKELDNLGQALYNKFGTDSYTERCTIRDLKAKIKAINFTDSSLQLKTDEKPSFEEYLKQIDKHFIYDDFLRGEFTYTVGDLYREYTQAIK